VVVALVVGLDQAVKAFVLARLELGAFVPFLGPRVGWQLVLNPGAAFGVPLPAAVFPLVTLVVVVVVVRSLAAAPPPALVVAQGLVVGGAIGNVLDRVVRASPGSWVDGRVVDFVAWGSFPRFNVADAAITAGVALLLLLTVRDELEGRAGADGTLG